MPHYSQIARQSPPNLSIIYAFTALANCLRFLFDSNPRLVYSNSIHLGGVVSEWFKVQTWKVCVVKATESSNLSDSATPSYAGVLYWEGKSEDVLRELGNMVKQS